MLLNIYYIYVRMILWHIGINEVFPFDEGCWETRTNRSFSISQTFEKNQVVNDFFDNNKLVGTHTLFKETNINNRYIYLSAN